MEDQNSIMFRNLHTALSSPHAMTVTLAAAGILMVTMGTRQSLGLFVSPINSATEIGIVGISLALAIGQFSWGLAQPVAGWLSDRYGPARVLVTGIVLLALGCALAPYLLTGMGLIITLGILAAMGSGFGSFSVLIGATAQRIATEARGPASGVINAGGSLGQFIGAPIFQGLIQSIGWVGSLWAMALLSLSALPLIGKLTGRHIPKVHAHNLADNDPFGKTIRDALSNPSYFLLNLGFFTCGFHIAFLVTHLPGEVSLCGLPASVAGGALAIIGLSNIFGSLYAGQCVARYKSKYILAAMYGSRVLLIAGYLLLPKNEWTFYLFAAGLGFTWLATVPPTASIVGKLFGLRYLATLFGVSMLSHQVGAFFGAYLGGVALAEWGNLDAMWIADMALAALAALVNLPIREPALKT
jgi:MFS family permease